jgi:hypothetical protein
MLRILTEGIEKMVTNVKPIAYMAPVVILLAGM